MAALLLVAAYVTSIWVNTALVNVVQSLAMMGLWTAIAVAVLKYRLYEIDRIISRTVTYAVVSGLSVGLYASLVLLANRGSTGPGTTPTTRSPHSRCG